MLRTGLQTARIQAASRFPTAARYTLRTQFTPSRTLTQRTFATTRSTPKAKPTTTFTFSSRQPPTPQTLLQRLRARFFHSSRRQLNGKPSPDPTPNLGSPAGATETEAPSLGARMRKLSREYGWSVIGVYAALSALDFPFCYLLVRTLGADRIGEWEHIIVSHISAIIPSSIKETYHDWRNSMRSVEETTTGSTDINDGVAMAGWGVEEAEERNKAEASLATQLALAYAIHKSFIFIRVPLTAAITPKVVKILRGWGWDIGKRTTKEVRAANIAARPVKGRKGK